MKTLTTSAAVIMLACFTGAVHAQVGGAKKTGDSRIAELLREAELKYTVDNDGDFRLVNSLEGGRTQVAFIISNTSTLGLLEIREIWSAAYSSKAPLSAEVANRLLEQNSKVKLGAWQVRKMGDNYIVMFVAQIAATTDRLALLVALHAVTATADQMENELTGKDDF